MDNKSYEWTEKYVRKLEENPDGIYDISENRGMLPPNVPQEIYNERAAYTCSDTIHDEAFRQDEDLLNTKVLHKSEYNLYIVGGVHALKKYSTYTHDLTLHGLLLHE